MARTRLLVILTGAELTFGQLGTQAALPRVVAIPSDKLIPIEHIQKEALCGADLAHLVGVLITFQL